jgi:Lrp/AsnC family transcriptional regulator, regulator for asnA, asnC and gidA
VDAIDTKMILELQRDARCKYVDIAKKLGMSEAAVRKRVAHLVQDGTVHLTTITNPGKVGYHSSAIIGLLATMGKLQEVTNRLLEHPHIQFVGIVAGRYDVLVSVICRSPKHLSKFIQDDLSKIKGITRAETFVILETRKRAYWSIPELIPDEE